MTGTTTNGGLTKVYFTATERIVGGVIVTILAAIFVSSFAWVGGLVGDMGQSVRHMELSMAKMAVVLDERGNLAIETRAITALLQERMTKLESKVDAMEARIRERP